MNVRAWHGNSAVPSFELASEARHHAGLLILECGSIALSLPRGVGCALLAQWRQGVSRVRDRPGQV